MFHRPWWSVWPMVLCLPQTKQWPPQIHSYHVLIPSNIVSIHFSTSSVLRIVRSTALLRRRKHSLVCRYVKIGLFSGWGGLGRESGLHIFALQTSVLSQQHYTRCCQHNNKGKGEGTHCPFEVV